MIVDTIISSFELQLDADVEGTEGKRKWTKEDFNEQKQFNDLKYRLDSQSYKVQKRSRSKEAGPSRRARDLEDSD